jgi:three-Cys-motif partner protein
LNIGPQRFGGPWSLVKIEAVSAYLQGFNTALKNRSFKRLYIDAFAGSGEFAYREGDSAPLFDEAEAVQTYAGSARRALAADPPFHQLIFVEHNEKNVLALHELAASDSKSRATVVQGDANTEVVRICRDTDWRNTRGVIFLDPFGNSVAWTTLEAIARTEALDVWYLFPLAGVYRNAPHDREALTPDKRQTISRVLGTEEWEERFYAQNDEPDLFESAPTAGRRTLNVDGIETFVTDRLKAIFPLVEKPRRLLGPTDAPLFSLFFAMANPSRSAHRVARPIAAHILKSI